MTVLEMNIKDILMKYGFHRHCICYREKCLVLPEEMIQLAAETIARSVQYKNVLGDKEKLREVKQEDSL